MWLIYEQIVNERAEGWKVTVIFHKFGELLDRGIITFFLILVGRAKITREIPRKDKELKGKRKGARVLRVPKLWRLVLGTL